MTLESRRMNSMVRFRHWVILLSASGALRIGLLGLGVLVSASLLAGVASMATYSLGEQPVGETPVFVTYLPLVQHGNQPAPPPVAEWDPRLDQRGAFLIPAEVTEGEGYWRLARAVWYDAVESQGRHHIFVDVLDSAGERQVGAPVLITWRDDAATIMTQAKPGEPYAADFAMFALAPAYLARPNDGAPADAVGGMGLGEIDDPNRAHHTSYGLVWQWREASATPTPSTTPTLVASETPTAVGTETATPTAPATPTATPTPTATAALPFPHAEVAGCIPDDAATRFSGAVFVGGEPADGHRVVFRFGEGYGDWATPPVVTGPNPPGFYTHIIRAGVAVAGRWSAWLVNEAGAPISVAAIFDTDGVGGGCNVVTVNFYDE